jgi:Na+/proline symporter
MRTIDWIVCIGFLVYMVWTGLRRGREAKSLEGYYAGNRRIPWWAAGLSVMGTQISAITILGLTSQAHESGMGFVQTYFGLPFAMIVLSIFMVPMYRSRMLLTAYEYLEGRFGPATRAIASIIFLVSRCLAIGVSLYTASVVLSAMLGLPPWSAIAIIATLATLYTVVAGIVGVVWTDVRQMAIIGIGLIATLAILLHDLLPHFGFGRLLELAGAADKLDAVSVQPESTAFVPRTLAEVATGSGTQSFWEQKYNLWAGLFGGLFLHMAYFGCDFSQAQRMLTSSTMHESRLALLLSAFAKVPMQACILFIGVLIWMFYAVDGGPMLFRPHHVALAQQPEYAPHIAEIQQRYDAAAMRRRELMLELATLPTISADNPQLAAYRSAVREVATLRVEARRTFGDPSKEAGQDVNYIFCRYAFDHLPPVVLGLVIAAIFAAAIASSAAEINALSAATIVDLYRRWFARRRDERHYLVAGRVATFVWGAFAAVSASVFAGGGSVIETINMIGSFFYGSLLGIFALAALVRRASAWAGAIGLLLGMATVFTVHNTLKVEFLWYNVIGCIAVLAFGWLVSWFEPRRAAAATATG